MVYRSVSVSAKITSLVHRDTMMYMAKIRRHAVTVHPTIYRSTAPRRKRDHV